IADVGATVMRRVAVEDFAPAATEWYADAIAVPRHRRHIADDQHRRRIGGVAYEREHRIGAVVADRPLKAGPVAVALMQRQMRSVECIEIADEVLDAGMRGIIERRPIEIEVVIPFALLGELAAHEQKLLAGMAPHE